MKRALKIAAILLALLAALAGVLGWHLGTKQPQRSGKLALEGLQAPVEVRWDEVGVPHIKAGNEPDLYRALGYLHAQDRLFQMEMVRRLSRGELAEVLGPKLVETDRLFRSLGIRAHADAYAARELARPPTPALQAMQAYLAGINEYQATRPAPLEFEILGIPKRPFTLADTVSVAGYLAYSFAVAFRTEPVLTYVRDKLGPDYLRAFDLDWRPEGAVRSASGQAGLGLQGADWAGLTRLARAGQEALEAAGLPLFEGSNAWAISGARTVSGKPLLAGDPHIAFSAPAVWWEAHLQSPGFELYGHFQALNPMALLGHNRQFAWSLTMFQNDDLDLIVEKPNPDKPGEVWVQGRWVPLLEREESILVKGAEPVRLKLQRSPHGPIVNAAMPGGTAERPVAMWWAFLETENPVLEAFYALNRANSLGRARAAASQIHAPGLNVVWAHADGDIGWWAAARLPKRPAGVNPSFLLDGSTGEADKLGFEDFSSNPQQENPARGYVVSANHQPAGSVPVPGYYNLWDRAQRLDEQLRGSEQKWDSARAQALQLDVQSGYAQRVLQPVLPALRAAASGPAELALVERLAAWPGKHELGLMEPVLFHQFLFELTREAMADEMGEPLFDTLRRSRALDHALPRLTADAASPWWDKRGTPEHETREQIVALAWKAALKHLQQTFGDDTTQWTWGRAHTLTHGHPLGQQKPLDRIFNVGPLPAPGAHELPNNLAQRLGPAPWAVVYGPSTRRVVDLARAGESVGINPVGQSGVWGDPHYEDQARMHVQGRYRGQWLNEPDVRAHTRSTLMLNPKD